MTAHEAQAQAAGEEAVERLWQAEEHGECVCPTCIVREVLEAAWPHLRHVARAECADELRHVVRLHGDGPMPEFAVQLGRLTGGWMRGE